jgi:L,D-transpeptidase catalytic domain
LTVSRRWFLGTGLFGIASATAWPHAHARAGTDGALASGLLQRALAALDQHRDRIEYRDVVAVADFSLPSRAPRLYLVDLAGGSVRSHWVAHGRGSDPARTGWLERFSNEPHSNATAAGAYRTAGTYFGAHGRSIRLEGLDPTNSNAAARAIVVHAAWYVSATMIGRYGMLGRSQGCFAVSDASLEQLLTRLSPGHLIYADRA